MNMHSSNFYGKHVRELGFSLLEVLIALLVISFGLLGIAGMQALSISNTGVAGFRSVAAIQAARMAAAMQANEGYWQQTLALNYGSGATEAITVNGTTITSSLDTSIVGSSVVCTYASVGISGCTSPNAMAAYDLQLWGTDLLNILPAGNGAISCTGETVAGNTIETCQITINWLEKSLVQSVGSLGSSSSTQEHYTLEVQP